MAYLIFIANGEEYDRRELKGGAITIGRAPDCDYSIHDIILSRHHCRIEKVDGRWTVTDLHSKNGTFLRGKQVQRHDLHDSDELRIGRTRLTFKAGAFVKSSKPKKRPAITRAADPSEALAGTVTGMVVCEPGEMKHPEGMPKPQPRPRDPSGFQRDDVYGMINEIASSSWDSIQAENSRPLRMERATPSPAIKQPHERVVRPKPRVSFHLQAGEHEHHDEPSKSHTAIEKLGAAIHSGHRWKWILAAAVLIAIACWAVIALRGWSRSAQEVSRTHTTFVGIDLASNYLLGY
jgi:predicted component of type VI protein secretion system